MNFNQLIVALGAILVMARVVGWVFQSIGQPRVIGEMTAGILLGPSVFGRFFPNAFHSVFPPSSFPAIALLSQLGLLLFMFVVGLEVDLAHVLKQRAAGDEDRVAEGYLPTRCGRRHLVVLYYCPPGAFPATFTQPAHRYFVRQWEY